MFFQILLFSIILLFLHELGHVISAKILGLKIKNISFLFKPYPHFFVAVFWPNNNKERMIYLFSGVFITLSLFAISICFNFFNLKALYIAFIIQIIIESNPFYSDYTIAIMSNDKKIKYGKNYGINYTQHFSKYQFSFNWYLHFIIWTLLIILLIKLNIFL
jgi:hypothetical protein